MSLLLIFLFLWSCGKKEEEEVIEEPSTIQDINGVISTFYGSSEDLRNWKLFLIEKGRGFGFLANISANGTFLLQQVDTVKDYTLILFSIDSQLASVLTLPTAEDPRLFQYFKPHLGHLPYIVYHGPKMTFGDDVEVTLDPYVPKDENKNGIPDGMDTIWSLLGEAPNGNQVNLTQDALSFDLDNDGINNYVDRDDDGDGLPDYLDSDSNANGTDDIFEQSHDQYFDEGLDFVTATLEKADLSATNSEYALSFTVKVKDDYKFESMSLLGPSSLFENATSVKSDLSEEAWNGELYDDGNHGDLKKGDSFYSVKIRLPVAELPRRYQTFFVKLVVLEEDGTLMEHYYPQNLPDVTLGTITATASSNVVSISGEPLGADIAFTWTVLVFDRNSNMLFSSKEIDSTTTSFAFPNFVLPARSDLTTKVIAISPQRIEGYPSYRVHSVPVNLDLSQ